MSASRRGGQLLRVLAVLLLTQYCTSTSPRKMERVGDVCSLQNDILELEFVIVENVRGNKDFQLVTLRSLAQTTNVIVQDTGVSSIWAMTFADTNGLLHVASADATPFVYASVQDSQNISLHWDSIRSDTSPNSTLANVSLSVALPFGSQTAQFRFSAVNAELEATTALWDYTVQIAGLPATQTDYVFLPQGFGYEYINPNFTLNVSVSAVYPSNSATMQFLAAGGSKENSFLGAYVGMHDPTASYKTLTATVFPSNIRPFFGDADSTNSTPSIALSFTQLVENAGLAWVSYTQPFDLAVGPISSDPLWFGAAQLYREWVMSSQAPWIQAGVIAQRSDYPDWLLKNNLWINSGWQCVDPFNATEGDPAMVIERVTNITQLLNVSFAFHWYEWQQGPDPDPSARYVFDTHYPDYFPPRSGFAQAIHYLQDSLGIHVVPYVNGREFAVNSTSYMNDNGGQYCAQHPNNISYGADTNLTFYIEEYGSNATFHPADPTTAYWQTTISAVATQLAQDYQASGVYLDQLASSSPCPDWTRDRAHPLGGGSYWTDGVNGIFETVRKNNSDLVLPLVTEGNAEPYIASANGFLTLTAFIVPFMQNWQGSGVPAFPAVYGGYYMAFGSIFNLNDFQFGDMAFARLALQFVYGAQLGWFSLGGTETNAFTRCGAMGVYDFLTSNQSTQIVQFIRTLDAYRSAIQPYFNTGRLMLPVKILPGPLPLFSDDLETQNQGPLPSIASATWQVEKSTILVLCSPVGFNQLMAMELNMLQYGYDEGESLSVSVVEADGSRSPYKNVIDSTVSIDRELQPYSVLIFEIVPL